MQKSNAADYRCRQLGLVELVFNMSTILLYDSLQATPPLVDTLINELFKLYASVVLIVNDAISRVKCLL